MQNATESCKPLMRPRHKHVNLQRRHLTVRVGHGLALEFVV